MTVQNPVEKSPVEKIEASFADNRSRLETMGRWGFIGNGVVQLLVGLLVLQMAFDLRGGKTGSRAALEYLFSLPWGQFLLLLLILGLGFHAYWRFAQGILDLDEKGNEIKGRIIRAGFILIGLINVGLALAGIRILLGLRRKQTNWEQSLAAQALAHPLGRYLVYLAGAATIGVGIYCLYQAVSAKFRKRLHDPQGNPWLILFGRLGFAARSVIYSLMGSLIISAAWFANPRRVRSFESIFQYIDRATEGGWLLSLLAIGLMCYGIYMLLLAKERKLN